MTSSGKRDKGPAPAAPQGNHHSVSSPSKASSPVLDRAIQSQIGDKLRALYGELSDQPVPDRLTAILARIGGADSGSQS